MKLTCVERWILSNQHDILAKLEPDSASEHKRTAEALRNGYECAYLWEVAHIEPDEDVLSSEAGTEVMNILDMFTALQMDYRKLTDKDGIDPIALGFDGFDGNSEKQFSFANFLRAEGKWSNLETWGDDGNSHCPEIENYRAMLSIWNSIRRANLPREALTKEDILSITSARYNR